MSREEYGKKPLVEDCCKKAEQGPEDHTREALVALLFALSEAIEKAWRALEGE